MTAWPDLVECIAQQLISSRLESVCWFLSVTSTCPSLLPSRTTVTPIAFPRVVASQLVTLRRRQSYHFRCSVRQQQVTSDERGAALSARLQAEDAANKANQKGQEDEHRVITQVNQAHRCRDC